MAVTWVLAALRGLSRPPFPNFGGRSIEKLKCFNHLLSAVLQGYKGRCEALSMQLGQREAEATALRLALQYRSVHPTHGITGVEGNGHAQEEPPSQRESGPLQESTFPLSPRVLKEFTCSQGWGLGDEVKDPGASGDVTHARWSQVSQSSQNQCLTVSTVRRRMESCSLSGRQIREQERKPL